MQEFCMAEGYMTTESSKLGVGTCTEIGTCTEMGTCSGQYGTRPNPEFAADTDQGKLLGVNF